MIETSKFDSAAAGGKRARRMSAGDEPGPAPPRRDGRGDGMATRGQHFDRHARAVTSSVRILHLASRPKERSGAITSAARPALRFLRLLSGKSQVATSSSVNPSSSASD